MIRITKLLTLILALALFVGCSSDSSNTDEAKELRSYMTANGMDLNNVLTSWITDASAIKDNLGDYNIIDIRSADDYNAGHVAGAVNSTLANIVTTAASFTDTDKDYIIICYTGQSAGHGNVALRLSGYFAINMKWGMSGWGPTWDRWSANQADIAIGHSNWVEPADADPAADEEYSYPELNTGNDNGSEILAARVQAMLEGGFKSVSSSDVLANPGNYFINNYWALTDVQTYGHIAGAHRINTNLTLADGGIKMQDKSKTVVTYCWTGQTSSMITAYMTVLGYDAKSLKFGVNSMIYSNLSGHKYSTPATDNPVE
jgi:rhodanese-related sulfurtransferase